MDSAAGNKGPIEIEDHDRFVEARFLGNYSFERFKDQAETASQACHQKNKRRLLVDLTCFETDPTMVERYELACHAVKVSAGLKVALFSKPKFVDRNKFGILVAQNRGLIVDVFTERDKAVDWLLSPATDLPASDREAT